jgi:Domain of unknown function (DUF4224)
MNLSDSEIDEICSGYVQNAAKIRFLESLGLSVRRKPNGKPLVSRAQYEQVMGCKKSDLKQTMGMQPAWGVH